jgi:Major intrinsic protein
MNPSRCFGLMAATQSFRGHWIMWVAPIAAAIVNGIFYWAVPPYHAAPKPQKEVCDKEEEGCQENRV